MRFVILFFAFACFSALAQENATIADDKLQSLEILTTLFNQTSGSEGHWKVRDGWLTTSNFCSWYGITCYGPEHTEKEKVGHVKEVNLRRNDLFGTIPAQVFDLPFLYKLNVADNLYASLSLSRLSNARFLRILNLSRVGVWDTLDRLSDAPRQLRRLRISRLEFVGPFPEGIYKLRGLKYLDARYNSFGPLSTKIGNLRKLRELRLYNGIAFPGTLPSEIGQLRRIKILDLGVGAFNGTLPHEAIDRLTRLEELHISQFSAPSAARLEGRLPTLSKMPRIRRVDFGYQRLTGTIPDDFVASAAPNSLIFINLEANRLTGQVPVSLDRFCCMDLFVAGNRLTFIPQEFCDNEQWMGGRVEREGCPAIVCPLQTWTFSGRQDDDFPKCKPCPSLEGFDPAAFDHFVGMNSCPATMARDCQKRAQHLATRFAECHRENSEETALQRECKKDFKERYKRELALEECSVDGVLQKSNLVLEELLDCLAKEEGSDNADLDRECGAKAVPLGIDV